MAETKIFYASDIHGSDICFRKFISAGKFYGVDILVLGGDITGKFVIPVVEQSDGSYAYELYGERKKVGSGEELKTIETKIRDIGYYPYRTTVSEFEDLQKAPDRVNELFTKLMVESVEKWMTLLESNMKGKNIKCFVMPGNDDRLEIDRVLEKNEFALNPEGRVERLDSIHEMISTGYSNMTPWKCPRDITEEELGKKIDSMVSQVKDMKNCVFNFHCPPFDSEIDMAPHLDADMRPMIKGGGIEMIPVGSTAIRTSIEKHQPLLGMHGHIHESKGFKKIGRTLCVNAGSEYGEGYLRGIIIVLDDNRVKKHQFTSG